VKTSLESNLKKKKHFVINDLFLLKNISLKMIDQFDQIVIGYIGLKDSNPYLHS